MTVLPPLPRNWRPALALYLFMTMAHPAGAAEQRISLNFVNADIGEVLGAIGQTTGKTFVVDPRVKGTLNIASPKPVPKSVAYDILLSALRLQGYAAVEADGVVRVVPEADAKYYALPAGGASKRGKTIARGQMVSRVFQLKHESAAQLMTVLRPLVSPNNVINADVSSNSLLVTDYADNVARLAEIIANLDLPDTSEPVIIPLRYAAAQEIAGLLNRVFANTATPGQGVESQRVEVAVDNRSNSLIVQSGNPSKLARVQALVAKMDVPTPMAGNVHVIYLKNAQAEKVAQTLRSILNSDTGNLQSQGTQTPQSAVATAAGQKTGLGSTAELGPGMVQADTASNALIVTAPEAVFNNIKAVVEKLDVRRAQVLVEALIAEVSADKAAEFGIQWAAAGDSSGTTVGGLFGNSNTSTNIGTVAAAAASGQAAAIAGVTSGLNIALFNNQSLGLLARALETKADANILSTPTILTLDNEEAKISIGSNVPFLTGQYSVTGSSTTANPFSTFERKDVGLILKVKPRISEGGTINLVISQEVSKLRESVDPTKAATDKRSIDSTVLIDDGQIVVLGGLIEEQVQDSEDKVPVLGDIPGLGNLFRYNSRKHVKTNLMVFLRPVIVRDANKAADVTHARYDYIMGVQKASAVPHKLMLPDAAPPTLDRGFSPAQTAPAP